MTRRYILLLLIFGFFAKPVRAGLTIGGAISMSDALAEVAAAYPGEKPRLSFSGSNVIARQIESGAPMDIFISADRQTMASLIEEKWLEKPSEVMIASNLLVVVLPKGSEVSVESAADLMKLKRIAIANPAAVPAGMYAEKWLSGAGLWQKIQPKLIPLQNVRSALMAAETGNVDAAIVYQTDARSSSKVRIAFAVAAQKTGQIQYPAAIVSSSRKKEEARRFIAFLTSDSAQTIFGKHGFTKP